MDGNKELWDCVVCCEICTDEFYGPLDSHTYKSMGSIEMNGSGITVAVLQQRAVIFPLLYLTKVTKMWAFFPSVNKISNII